MILNLLVYSLIKRSKGKERIKKCNKFSYLVFEMVSQIM